MPDTSVNIDCHFYLSIDTDNVFPNRAAIKKKRRTAKLDGVLIGRLSPGGSR